MEGRILWILCENNLYCSEIRKVCIGSPDKEHICIYLNPIIGDIDLIIFLRGQTGFINFVMDCYIFRAHNNYPDFKNAKISFDFDKLSKHLNTNS